MIDFPRILPDREIAAISEKAKKDGRTEAAKEFLTSLNIFSIIESLEIRMKTIQEGGFSRDEFNSDSAQRYLEEAKPGFGGIANILIANFCKQVENTPRLKIIGWSFANGFDMSPVAFDYRQHDCVVMGVNQGDLVIIEQIGASYENKVIIRPKVSLAQTAK